MSKIFLVGLATGLKFIGQFLFIKSVSHLTESNILQALNLQSLAVLIAGFSSGGIQTYLAKHIPVEKIKTTWSLCSRNTFQYFLYSIFVIIPLFLIINKAEADSVLLVAIVILAPLLAYSNNWQGLLTGLKNYHQLVLVFVIQTIFFFCIFLFRTALPDFLFAISYPAVVVLSFMISYFYLSKKVIPESTEAADSKLIQREVSGYRVMGIVQMTAGVAYPFLIRNILSFSYNLETVVNWDYLMRISTAYISVSVFFIFTLFSSDLSKNQSKKVSFFVLSFGMVSTYLMIFYFFSFPVIKILLSREIPLSNIELFSFIGFEIARAFFALICLYNIIRGETKRYVILELSNIALSALTIYFMKPEFLEQSFHLLGGCFFIALTLTYVISPKLKKR